MVFMPKVAVCRRLMVADHPNSAKLCKTFSAHSKKENKTATTRSPLTHGFRHGIVASLFVSFFPSFFTTNLTQTKFQFAQCKWIRMNWRLMAAQQIHWQLKSLCGAHSRLRNVCGRNSTDVRFFLLLLLLLIRWHSLAHTVKYFELDISIECARDTFQFTHTHTRRSPVY